MIAGIVASGGLNSGPPVGVHYIAATDGVANKPVQFFRIDGNHATLLPDAAIKYGVGGVRYNSATKLLMVAGIANTITQGLNVYDCSSYPFTLKQTVQRSVSGNLSSWNMSEDGRFIILTSSSGGAAFLFENSGAGGSYVFKNSLAGNCDWVIIDPTGTHVLIKNSGAQTLKPARISSGSLVAAGSTYTETSGGAITTSIGVAERIFSVGINVSPYMKKISLDVSTNNPTAVAVAGIANGTTSTSRSTVTGLQASYVGITTAIALLEYTAGTLGVISSTAVAGTRNPIDWDDTGNVLYTHSDPFGGIARVLRDGSTLTKDAGFTSDTSAIGITSLAHILTNPV